MLRPLPKTDQEFEKNNTRGCEKELMFQMLTENNM